MDKHKLSLIGAGMAAAVLVAGGWFIGIQPQLASAAADDAQRATIESTNTTNRDVLRKLEADFRELPRSQRALAELQKSVPSTPDTAGFTREVDEAVSSSGVQLTSLTFGALSAYVPLTDAAGAQAGAGSTPTASPTPAPTATAVPSPSSPAAPAAPQPYRNDQITSNTFDLLPVTIAVDATSYEQALDVAKRLQHGQRLFLVDSLSQTTKEDSATAQSWSLAGYIYVVHASQADEALGSSASGAAATSAPSGSPTAVG